MPRSGKKRPGLGLVVLCLAILLGGWLAFDGARALIVGDYVTPESGEYAGRLGPWAGVVSAVGLEPRSTGVKVIHLVLGLAWLVAALCYAYGVRGARDGLLACAVLSLWYLPFGTILGVLLIVLLWLPSLRRAGCCPTGRESRA
jgi:hypothetical protein